MVVTQGEVLLPSDYPQRLTAGPQGRDDGGIQIGMTVHEMERRLIMKTLESHKGNRTEAAVMLGISTRTLRNKLHEYGEMKAFKESGDQANHEEEAELMSAMA
ncbi:MAG: helix-turn-helix domain-containing protein [Candidatus Latescibacterota bacterium]|nr:helix-turn-helix domain-containing protein [Candidatus Latescibacterota bacterium]